MPLLILNVVYCMTRDASISNIVDASNEEYQWDSSRCSEKYEVWGIVIYMVLKMMISRFWGWRLLQSLYDRYNFTFFPYRCIVISHWNTSIRIHLFFCDACYVLKEIVNIYFSACYSMNYTYLNFTISYVLCTVFTKACSMAI